MPVVSRQEIKSLALLEDPPAVSIFMPAHPSGRETQQGPVRLGNLLREAERRLLAAGCSSTQARTLLSSAAGFIEDADFWRHQESRLAMFL